MGLSTREWLGHLVRQPATLPGAVLATARQVRVRLFKKLPSTMPSGDPEEVWYSSRYNWMLAALETNAAETVLRQTLEHQTAAETLERDTYSCANRIGNLVYLLRHLGSASDLPQNALLAPLLETAHTDADFISRNPEFGGQTVWFCNHLLNDYRALCLYRMALGHLPLSVDVLAGIENIEYLLSRHLDTLFDDGPILQEGSVSYEILILKHLVDIACCGRRSPLADQFRGWVIGRGRTALLTYRKNGNWLLPQSGDLTPDLRQADMLSFLDGYVLERPSAYRKVWEHELSALGL